MAEPQNTEAQPLKDDISILKSQIAEFERKQDEPTWNRDVDFPILTKLRNQLAELQKPAPEAQAKEAKTLKEINDKQAKNLPLSEDEARILTQHMTDKDFAKFRKISSEAFPRTAGEIRQIPDIKKP